MDELVKAHSAYVARLAYRVLGRDDEVRDLVQDVFLAFLRFHRTIREPAAVRAWLGTTTVRLARKRLRARQRRWFIWLQPGEGVDVIDCPASGASAEDHAAFVGIQRALEGVPAEARIAWVLRYLEQERVEDVARLCRCSLATAKRRIAAAQSVVKRVLGS